MHKIIGRNIKLFRDRAHFSYVELSDRVLRKHSMYISPIEILDFENGDEISAIQLFYIALELRVCVTELMEENPIF